MCLCGHIRTDFDMGKFAFEELQSIGYVASRADQCAEILGCGKWISGLRLNQKKS